MAKELRSTRSRGAGLAGGRSISISISRSRSRGLACALAALSLTLAGSAAAQPAVGHKEQVLTLYQVGRQLLEAGRVDEACGVLEQARKLDPTALNLLLRLGECLTRMGRTASAWNVLDEAAALAKSARDPRAARAEELATALGPRLSRLTITVPPASADAGIEVRYDGARVPQAQWGQSIPVDPGTHTIEAKAPGKKRWSITRNVGADSARVVVGVPVLENEAPPDHLATAPRQPVRKSRPPLPTGGGERGSTGSAWSAWNVERVLALVSGGVGLAGLGVGAGFGAQAVAKLDASNDGHCGAGNRCDAVGVTLRADAQAAGTASTVAFSIGAAALLAGGVLFWTAPPARADDRGRSPRGPAAFAVIGPGAGALVVRGSY